MIDPIPIRVRRSTASNGLERRIEHKGDSLEGYTRFYRADGTLYHVIPYENNEKHGEEMMWFADGRVRKRHTWIHGKEGDGIGWFPCGALYWTHEVSDGRRTDIFYYRNGQMREREIYDPVSWSRCGTLVSSHFWNAQGDEFDFMANTDTPVEEIYDSDDEADTWDHIADPDEEDESALDDEDDDDDDDDEDGASAMDEAS
jgi:hypothetical protein